MPRGSEAAIKAKEAIQSSEFCIFCFLIPNSNNCPNESPTWIACISTGTPSNYIIFHSTCSQDVILCYIHPYFGFVWSWCGAVSWTTRKSSTLGQLFESLYPCFSEFFLNLDRCNCILLQAVVLKLNLYISLYDLSCHFIFKNCRILVQILKYKGHAEIALSIIHTDYWDVDALGSLSRLGVDRCGDPTCHYKN